MATNPMQRKARQSFLLGMGITLLIAVIIIFLIWQQTSKLKEQLNNEIKQKVKVYVLNEAVKSGDIITSNMFRIETVSEAGVPSGATGSDIERTLAEYSLCDEDGNLIYSERTEDGKQSLYMNIDGEKIAITYDDETGKYYNGQEEIKTTHKTIVAAIDMDANTIFTTKMLALSDEKITSDSREQTYNMISLPIDLVTGDYVDIRLMLPTGTDFIVLSKLKVTVPDNGAGTLLSDTIKVTVAESDLLTMDSAIVEAYKIEGSKLYAIKYVEPGNQDAAVITYKPRSDIVNLIENNPNIVKEAKEALKSRYGTNLVNAYRNQIDSYYKSGEDESVVSGIQESAEATKQAREEYLTSIYGGVAE